jgi:hypothetical protein
LAPRRAERTRLETALEDVWTKDILPFPGMALRRAENPIRASANSVMRKLSMASIASNFSKRSPSFTSLNHARSEEPSSAQTGNIRAKSALSDRRAAPVLVDFHNAPAAFLPTDFELQEKPCSRRKQLKAKTTFTERGSERFAKKARHDSLTQLSAKWFEPVKAAERGEDSHCSDDTVIHKLPSELASGILDSETLRCKSARSVPTTHAMLTSSAVPKKPSRAKSKLIQFFKQ